MNQAYLLSIAFGINVLILIPATVWAIKDTRRRRKHLKRYLQAMRYRVLRIRWGDSSKRCKVKIREHGEVKKIYPQCAYGHHFYIYDGKPEPSRLIFFSEVNSMKIYELPDSSLRIGYCLYTCRRVKNSRLVSAAGSILAGGTLGFFNWIATDMFLSYLTSKPPVWFRQVMEWLWQVDPTGSYIQILALIPTSIAAFAFFFPPVIIAGAIYWKLRGPLIISDTAICLKCTYDLRCNESQQCPECGHKIEPNPEGPVNALTRSSELMREFVPPPPMRYNPKKAS